MNKEEKETTTLAQELTIKDKIGILNASKSTPVERKVVVKAAELLTEAENNYLDRTENENADETKNSNTNFTIDDWLRKAAYDYFMGD